MSLSTSSSRFLWRTMLCHCSLAIFFIINVPIVTGLEPDFLTPMENVTVPKGRDAIFTCAVNHTFGGYRVSSYSSGGGARTRVAWIKADTKAVLAIHENVITNNARLFVTHNDYNTWTLTIRNATPTDRGIYMCQVNTEPMKSQSAYLEVVIPPDIISDDTSGDLMVPEGGSAKLVCKARGYPQPEITWKREGGGDITLRTGHAGVRTKVPAAHGETLTFQQIGRNDMGAYLCIASNGVPPSVSKRVMLQVHFHPLIEVPNQLLGAPRGTDVTLSCHVEASPKPINYWIRDTGEMIINSDRRTMTEEKSNSYSTGMKLVIRNLKDQDFGGYKCISKNSIGDAEGGIHLYSINLTENAAKNTYDDENHKLNNVYQGSLRESSTQSNHNRGSKQGFTTAKNLYSLIILCVIFHVITHH